MLSQKTIDIVKSTVPVLEVHGEAITRCFYKLMFTDHPELLNVFNQTNQKVGQQPKALAASVYAAAKHIDNLEAILPVVKQIGHKHRSLEIKPEHYPIVGKYLLLAIKEVLQDAATDEVIEAWGEAYGAIADVFISVEANMYKEATTAVGGWEGFRKFILARKEEESDVITSFYLKPEDGQSISTFAPGQYISIKVNVPGEEYTSIRQYSLSDAPNGDYYRISVKRESAKEEIPDGVVSTYLHDHVHEGDVVEITAPAGDFTLDTTKETPVLFISGGIGQTPFIPMLKTVAKEQPERKATFIHAAINNHFHALKDEVAEVVASSDNITNYVCYEHPTEADRANQAFDKEGYINTEWLAELITTKETDVYFCGPLPFMKAINQAVKEIGVPTENIHFEFFGPAGELE
ncbi:NO-inducible flavohemoprotein [Bacillus solimangrovi]|uniref:Flavohemoprotein n=1 Tax=Bacillus solimangrovi TaxID=1305675 RepID=A0A1E5LFV7_9BACI|nr:NO-inducible flavohemoprotein [Bacillus solimangrovi]OEH92950.1 nitric oxide dioxygenase [Bacillus solimangrovi]